MADRIAFFVVVAGTTTRGTCALRIATGTPLATGTTTLGSASFTELSAESGSPRRFRQSCFSVLAGFPHSSNWNQNICSISGASNAFA
ncbi:hypothetical protein MHK_004738 [Candidatus Magnetomorum sp. HK-1]|nr:hypothetical protein MHK_004738 [Candidatus Magnetomorum sp. HK-1]